MVFPGLYGPFGGIATVSVGRYSLESDVVFAEGLFEEVGAFIVKYVKIWGVDVVFESGVAKFPCVSNGFGLSVLDGYGKYGV